MKNGICIDLRMWENSTPGMNADGPQGLIDMDLEITNADLFCSGVCVYSNSFAGLCNQTIPFGLFEENNVIQSGEEFNITIFSSKKTTRDVYEEIKEFVCIYGKIEESVFDDGQIYINVITSRFENISQIESFIEGYDNLETACG